MTKVEYNENMTNEEVTRIFEKFGSIDKQGRVCLPYNESNNVEVDILFCDQYKVTPIKVFNSHDDQMIFDVADSLRLCKIFLQHIKPENYDKIKDVLEKNLPDLHKEASDFLQIHIGRVGVENVEFPLSVPTKEGKTLNTTATFSLFADLVDTEKGINMSRLPESLMESWIKKPISGKDFKELLKKMQVKMGSSDVYASAAFKLPLKRKAPASKKEQFVCFNCRLIGHLCDNKHSLVLEVVVPVASYCPCCFLPNTPVFTSQGITYIQDIKRGMKTSENKEITNVFSYPSEGKNYVSVSARGLLDTQCSSDHKFLVWRRKTWRSPGVYNKPFVFEWIPAQELTKKDYLVLPLATNNNEYSKISFAQCVSAPNYESRVKPINTEDITVNEELGRFFGLFIAEGSIAKESVIFSFNNKETHLVDFVSNCSKKYLGVEATSYTDIDRHTTSVILSRTRLCKWFINNFRDETNHVKVPSFITNSPNTVIKAFIQGWYEGDGSHTTTRNIQRITTVSKLAALQLQQLFLKLNTFMSISLCQAKNSKAYTKNGGKAIVQDQYQCILDASCLAVLDYYKGDKKRNNVHDNCIFTPVKEVKAIKYKGLVYDLEVENTQYTIPFIVHNSKRMSTFDEATNSGYGAHAQRCNVTLQIRIDDPNKYFIWFEDLIELVESCGSSPLYTLLKRIDEQYVTVKGYAHPKFTEDVAREVAHKVMSIKGVNWLRVKTAAQESLHPYQAVAILTSEKNGKAWIKSNKGAY